MLVGLKSLVCVEGKPTGRTGHVASDGVLLAQGHACQVHICACRQWSSVLSIVWYQPSDLTKQRGQLFGLC